MSDICSTPGCRGEVVITHLKRNLCQRCWYVVCAKDEKVQIERERLNAKPWVLFDASWLAYRAIYSTPNLDHGEYDTAVPFGFLQQMLTVCQHKRINSNRVIVCFDSGLSARRREYPGYKNRKHTDPSARRKRRKIKRALRLLRTRVLPDIGIPVLRQPGLESDDLMAQCSHQIYMRCGRAVLVTADSDLYQCITNTIHWFDPSRDIYYDAERFLNEKKLMPRDWARAKCIAGCDTDTVDGVVGVGMQTAINYIWKLLSPTSVKYNEIEGPRGRSIIKRNERLILLPYKRTCPVELPDVKDGTAMYSLSGFKKWARRLGFKSFLHGERKRQWANFLSGQSSSDRVSPRRPWGV